MRKQVSKSANQKPIAFGNQDSEHKYPITQDVIDKGLFVLLHYKHHTIENINNPQERIDSGDIDSSSLRIQTYKRGYYEEAIRENEDEQKVNTFNKMLGKYIILHNPDLETEDDEEGEDDLMQNTKAQLVDMLIAKEGVSDEDLKLAALNTTKKAEIIDLINKY